MLADIRKFSLDNWINELVDASKIKKNWFGKVTDNYWEYLGKVTTEIKTDFNAHILSDLLTFVIDELKFKEVLGEYSDKLTQNRNSAVFIFILDDKEKLLNEFRKSSFKLRFETFCKELNDNFYSYTVEELNETIRNFEMALTEIDENHSIIINIG